MTVYSARNLEGSLVGELVRWNRHLQAELVPGKRWGQKTLSYSFNLVHCRAALLRKVDSVRYKKMGW